ncbi:DMT family transporter [Laceyella putida]|uniref:DMT family transporter n=1 Tax=Laceyella putida TaxID=110101 RepID=A0ABW2RMM4_9BACL
MNLKNIGLLFALAALWGASFLYIRVASPVVGPVFLVLLRVGIALLTLVVYAYLLKIPFTIKKDQKKYYLLGLINTALPFVLISYAEVHITSSFAAILNATTPLFTALVARVWLKEWITLQKGLGLFVGFIGVCVLVGWSPMELTTSTILAILASLLAALFYGIGSTYAKKYFDASPLSLSIGQLFGSTVCVLPFSALDVPAKLPSLSVNLSILALAVLSTAFAYLLYFRLLKEVGPTQTTYVTMLVPAFGVIWGVMFLDETITAGTIIGMCLILLSIIFFSKLPLPKRKKATDDHAA